MKMTALIIDDEPLSRNFLRKFCDRSGMIDVLGSFSNAADAIPFLRNEEVSLIFLDVEMPGINGFEMLDQLESQPCVIMTTSKTDYAFTAFEYHVTDFLKKPVVYERFIEAVSKAMEILKQQRQQQEENKIVIKSNGDYIRLSHQDILYVEGMGDYVKYVTEGKTYITHTTMRAVEDSVGKDGFLKVHRSYIVNLSKINHLSDNNISINGASIPVSKSNKAELLERLRVH